MIREELIKELLETKDESEIAERLERIERKLDLILSVIVVQQKDACEAAGITAATVRNQVLRGDTEILQKNGSRINYLTLKQTGELKSRQRPKRRSQRR